MKFRGDFKVDNLQHFVGCLLSLSRLCNDLSATPTCYLKITQRRIAIIVRTAAFIDAYVEIDSTELLQLPFVLKSRTNNVIVLKVNIISLYEALNAATNSGRISIRLKRHEDCGALSINFTDPVFPSISITLDVIATPTAEHLTLDSVIPTIPPCSCNVGLTKLQSIIAFLESSRKIGNDVTALEVLVGKKGLVDDYVIDGQSHNTAILKLKSAGLLANLETYFYGMHIFSSFQQGPSQPTVNKNDTVKAAFKTDTGYLLCKNAVESLIACKNEALLVAAIPDRIHDCQWIYFVLSIFSVFFTGETLTLQPVGHMSSDIYYS